MGKRKTRSIRFGKCLVPYSTGFALKPAVVTAQRAGKRVHDIELVNFFGLERRVCGTEVSFLELFLKREGVGFDVEIGVL